MRAVSVFVCPLCVCVCLCVSVFCVGSCGETWRGCNKRTTGSRKHFYRLDGLLEIHGDKTKYSEKPLRMEVVRGVRDLGTRCANIPHTPLMKNCHL